MPDYSIKQGKPFGKVLLLFSLCIWICAHTDDKTNLSFSAETLESVKIDGETWQKLADNVLFTFEEFTIQADSAFYNREKGLIEAEGNVKIIHKNGVTIQADRLIYDEKNQLAQLRNRVIYQSDTNTFYTDHLDYYTGTHKGHFMGGGKLVEGENTLISESGYYDDIEKIAVFHQNVEMANQDYILRCNTLHYNTVTKVAQFRGHTQIISKDGERTLTTEEGGEYNASTQYSGFAKSKIETQDYTLYGELIRADQAKELYMITGNVKLVSKVDNVIISGDYGQYQKKEGVAQVYGNTLMQKILEEDILYVSADTFVATENKQTGNSDDAVIRAYHNVKIYKEGFQGKADAMVYQGAESIIYFYGDPIFWSNENQLFADSVRVVLQNKAFHEMHMNTNAFVISEDKLGNYNQLKGRDMIAHFQANKIDYITIDGNAEGLYFVIDKDAQLQGMNHIQCSQMRINIEWDELSSIAFQIKPQGSFYPPQLIQEEDKKLSNFKWRANDRPTKQEVIERGYGTHQEYKQFKFNKK